MFVLLLSEVGKVVSVLGAEFLDNGSIDVCVAPCGNVVVADCRQHRIVVFAPVVPGLAGVMLRAWQHLSGMQLRNTVFMLLYL